MKQHIALFTFISLFCLMNFLNLKGNINTNTLESKIMVVNKLINQNVTPVQNKVSQDHC